ncbi:hypothetical protein [Rufibacter aurantiacus]|uniref:hypothetical protein n=1 Tax=Rufibacter aurantiacus TaxID=2817374 RepID=UPI003D12EFA7
MGLFLELLLEAGYKKAYLWTTQLQTSAAQLYHKIGIVLSEERESEDFGKPLREQRDDLLF